MTKERAWNVKCVLLRMNSRIQDTSTLKIVYIIKINITMIIAIIIKKMDVISNAPKDFRIENLFASDNPKTKNTME